MLLKYILSIVLITLSLLCGSSCYNDNNAYWKNYSRETILKIINRPVVMPESIQVCYPDLNAYRQLMDSKVKILFNVDISCGVCLSKFHYWNEFINNYECRYGIKPSVLAIIVGSEYSEDIKSFILERWDYEWIYDSDGDFTFDNYLEDDRFQAILLDANDTIRLVGNPVLNESLGQLYEKTITKYMQ